MRAVSQTISILVCFTLLLGVKSQSDVVFSFTETEKKESSPSNDSRLLQQNEYESCYTSNCVRSYSGIYDEGEYKTIYIGLYGGAKIGMIIPVGGNKMTFSLSLDSSVTDTRTNIGVNPSDSWPFGAVPAVTGYSWTGDLSIPSSSDESRYLYIEIANEAFIFPTTVTFNITVTSVSKGLPTFAIIIIIVAAVLIAIVVTTCICVRVRRNRRLASQRAIRAQVTNQSSAPLYSHQQPQQMYNQELQSIDQAKPMYNQQPQMYPQQPMYAQQPQMYPPQPQMYPPQPQMYPPQTQMYPPQQQMYAQQPQMYPQQQMQQQQQPALVIQVGQVTQAPQ